MWCLRVRNSEQLQLGGSDSGFLMRFQSNRSHLKAQWGWRTLMGLLATGLTSLSDGVSLGYWVSLEPSVKAKNKSDSILDLFLLL